MALSDSCFEFLESVGEAARELAKAVHWYSAPDYPLQYGEEIDSLRLACQRMVASPYDAEAGAHLLRLASAVLKYLDAPPYPLSPEKQEKSEALIASLKAGVNSLDSPSIPSIIHHIINETPFTERASIRLRGIIFELLTPQREQALEIIMEVGSETAKGILGKKAMETESARPQVDVGILTIKDEEFEAVLKAFPSGSQIYVGPTSHRQYNLRVAETASGKEYQVAIIRQPEQGNGEAQNAARDFIEDLSPSLILVVGIAGALPSKDMTLGDVVLSLRIHDYSVEARQEGRETTYAISGGAIGKHIEHHVTNLKARTSDLGNWTESLMQQPPVVVDDNQIYGPDEWRKDVRESLEHHFSQAREPKFCSGVIASSDRLIKDTNVLIPWLVTSRNLLAVEMESGGVYRASRERCTMLAIRGISDIVGFKRDERWTRYACESAARFAHAYLRTEPIVPKVQEPNK